MQIHELNNFTGTLGSGAYLAIDDGTDTGKISSQGLLAATEARIDNIIAGPAPSAEEIVDARLGADGVTYPSLGDAIRDQFTDVKSEINELSETTRNLIFDKIENKVINSSGAIESSSGFDVHIAPVTSGQKYTLLSDESNASGAFYVYTIYENYPIVASATHTSRNISTNPVITASTTGYLLLRSTDNATEVQVTAGETVTEYIPHISAADYIVREKVDKNTSDVNVLKGYVEDTRNLIDPANTVNAFISSADGDMESSSTYYTTDFIPIASGQKVTISPNCRKFLAYDSDKDAISESYENGGVSSAYTYTATEDGYVRVSYTKTNLEQVEYGDTATEYAPFGKMLDNQFFLNDSQIEQVSQLTSILNGKKIVFCGDSFTQGDFTGLSPSEYKFPSGKYVGENMVYPFFIGLSTGANVVNEAISGSSMAYVDGQRNEFSTPNGRYTQIPVDADYIILYFGINDSHQMVPIGNIDDAVNTTFYGAWNIIMQYLITNYPNAKIGIIISNGCDNINYPNAEIEIAKKYGVSYLDINGDYKIPIVFRVNGKPNIDASIKTARLNYYSVNPNGGSPNYHPNVKMHKYEAPIFQKWIEGI